MKNLPSYPFLLSLAMLLGPFLMIAATFLTDKRIIWTCQIVGAGMVVFALFYLSKRLHEQMEEVAALRQLINSRKQ
jgi:hypothetical protein